MTRQPFVELKSMPLTLFVATKCKHRKKKNRTIVDIKQSMIQPSQKPSFKGSGTLAMRLTCLYTKKDLA